MEGLNTSKNFVRREIAAVANLEVEELDGSNKGLSGKHEFFSSEGIVVITLHPEGCIKALTAEFLVTSDENAPDLTIGHDLSIKIARLRDAIRSYALMKANFQYEVGIYSGLGDSEREEVLHSRFGTFQSAPADNTVPTGYLPTGFPSTGLGCQVPRTDQQDSEAPVREAGFDEKSPLISSQLPVPLVTCKSGDTDKHLPSSTVSRATTVDVPSRVNQTGAVLPVSTAPIARNPKRQECITLRLDRPTIVACVAGLTGLILLSSLLSSYLVQRWGVSH
jgi:hypothetical protein